MKWIFLLAIGMSWSGETADAEIIKDLDFFSAIDFFENYEAVSEEVPESMIKPETKKGVSL